MALSIKPPLNVSPLFVIKPIAKISNVFATERTIIETVVSQIRRRIRRSFQERDNSSINRKPLRFYETFDNASLIAHRPKVFEAAKFPL